LVVFQSCSWRSDNKAKGAKAPGGLSTRGARSRSGRSPSPMGPPTGAGVAPGGAGVCSAALSDVPTEPKMPPDLVRTAII